MYAGVKVLGLVISLAAFLAPASAFEDEAKCDVKTTRMEKVCGHCKEHVKADEHCGKMPDKVEFCVKVVYECEKCDATSAKAGKHCGGPMKKTEDLARVMWACPKCGAAGKEKGACEKCEKPLVKTCEKSGEKPHVGAMMGKKEEKTKKG